MKTIRLSALLAFVMALGACASLSDDPTKDWPAERLYQEARDALDSGNYTTAVGYYESLEARFPFGRYAQQAQLESIYAYYKSYEPDSAVAAADRYIELHPNSPNVAYAYYLKGLANFDRTKGYFDFIIESNPSENDPTPLLRAFNDFSYLVRNYPDSRYAEDARQRMVYLRNELAEHELDVADYYLRRGAWVAAANRAKYVVEHYQGAESMPKALGTMITAYRKLGLDELANDARRILELNFPERVEESLAASR
jgi:outer membrane protein assembly factor BamD